MVALRATVHTTIQYTPAQLIFGCDPIINRCQRKQDLINKGNDCKNCNRINHTYKQGDNVLLKNVWKTKFNQEIYIDFYIIIAVKNNGTVRARKSRVTDNFNV